MRIQDKYLQAIEDCDDWLTVSEWAVKVGEFGKKHSKNWTRFSLEEQVEYIVTAIKLQEIVAERLEVKLDPSVLTLLIQRLKSVY